MKNKFWQEEKEVFHPATEAELAAIDELSDKFDNDPDLQKKHGGNFYEFMAQSLREKGASK